MAYDLQLKKGGFLVTQEWSVSADDFIERKLGAEDVNFHMNDTICLENGVTLRDIFVLMSKNPYIYSVNSSCPFLDDLIGEALSVPSINEENNDIAALRLKWLSIIDCDADSSFLNCQMDFHGIGYKKRQHSVQFLPINELVIYPVILDEEFIIINENHILLQTTRRFSLIEMFRGIIEELSYMGPPEIKSFALQEIRDRDWYPTYKVNNMIEKEMVNIDKPCKLCGEESRHPSFGKPPDICANCFRKIKEN
jgi:hypothetical protein